MAWTGSVPVPFFIGDINVRIVLTGSWALSRRHTQDSKISNLSQ
jgi:hypothetical protein